MHSIFITEITICPSCCERLREDVPERAYCEQCGKKFGSVGDNSAGPLVSHWPNHPAFFFPKTFYQPLAAIKSAFFWQNQCQLYVLPLLNVFQTRLTQVGSLLYPDFFASFLQTNPDYLNQACIAEDLQSSGLPSSNDDVQRELTTRLQEIECLLIFWLRFNCLPRSREACLAVSREKAGLFNIIMGLVIVIILLILAICTYHFLNF